MIRALLFDLDGTLADTLPLYVASYRQVLAHLGFALTDKEIVTSCFGKTEGTICRALGIPHKTTLFGNLYFESVKKNIAQGKLFAGVGECLQLIRKKQFRFGLISFAYRWYVDSMLQELKIHDYFDTVIGFNDVQQAKPHPEAVHKVCTQMGIKPSQAVVVGDSASDIRMGKSAGSKTILFHPPGYEVFYDIEILKESQPDRVIEDFAKLTMLIKNNALF